MGRDANAHHIIQTSMDINQREECLMEYLVRTILNILNKGMMPTLVISKSKEVIDLTIAIDKTGNLVTKWHVFDKIPLSDHRYILFQITRVTWCNPKRTTWKSYWIDLQENLGSYWELYIWYGMQNWLLTWCNSLSYHQNFPAKDCLSQRMFLGGTKSSDVIKLLQDGFLIKLKQETGNHIRMTSPITIKRS